MTRQDARDEFEDASYNLRDALQEDTAQYRDAVIRAALLKRLDQFDKVKRAELGLRPGERQPGKVDGVTVGHVWVTDPDSKLVVIDPDRYLAWMAEHDSDSVVTETVRKVDPAVTKRILADGGIIDEDTGEITLPDGIIRDDPRPVLQVKPNAKGLAIADQMLTRTIEIEGGAS